MRARRRASAGSRWLPHTFRPYEAGGGYESARRRDWFAARALVPTRKFDRRNGNDYFTREPADLDALKRSAALPAPPRVAGL